MCVAGACACPAGQTACGICVNTKTSAEHCGACESACKSKAFCIDGSCTCGGMLSYCDEACVNTNNNPKHCGACGNQCPMGDLCISGACQ